MRATTCRVARVTHNHSLCHFAATPTIAEAEACAWRIAVVSDTVPRVHPLVFARASHASPLTPVETRWLVALHACASPSQCANATVPCAYGVEDPSDALWLREYQHRIKFVVMMKIGFLSLLVYVAAIVADGNIFSPHRSSFAGGVATIFILIAFAASLYIRLVPSRMQYSLLGANLFQTLAFLLIVLTIALILPAAAIIALNLVIFSVTFIWFFLEQTISICVGFVQFLANLSLFNVQHTYLCLRQIYFNGSESEYDQQLVSNSDSFLQQVRNNWFLHRVPRCFLENADLAVRTVLSENLRDQVDSIPYADMDSFASEDDQQHHAPSRDPEAGATETTALLPDNSGRPTNLSHIS
ncbi:unnamed protein product [Agarophyton chilense]